MKWETFRKSLGWILLVCVVVRWRTIECFSVEEEEERGREERGGAARFKRIRVLLCLCVMRDYIPLPNFVYACFTTLWWVYIMNRWFFDLTVTMKPPICSYVHLFNTPSVLRHSPLFLWKPFSLHVNFVHTFMHFYSSYSSYHALFCYIVCLISCILIQNIFYVMHHFII